MVHVEVDSKQAGGVDRSIRVNCLPESEGEGQRDREYEYVCVCV